MSRHVVMVTVSGPVGCGKSAVCGEIEILCRALGLECTWEDSEEEKRLTHADWTEALELYKPRVLIREVIEAQGPASPDVSCSCPGCNGVAPHTVVDDAMVERACKAWLSPEAWVAFSGTRTEKSIRRGIRVALEAALTKEWF